MKAFKFFSVLLVTAALLFNCTHDTEYITGPAGPAGADGIAGADGQDGADGGAAVCIDCHSNTHRDPIRAAYNLSKHAAGYTVDYAGARSRCAQCHSNEGYVDFMDTGSVNPAGYYGLSEPEIVINDNGTPDDESDDYPELDEYGLPIYSNNPVSIASRITCTTCHSIHQSFDFENDGNDYALRGLEPVTLMTDGTVLDFSPDRSNVCITCHQPRRTGPVDDGEGMFRVTSTHWGPHHGPQSTFLEGIQGMEIPGSQVYPAPQSATHRNSSSCVECHMAPSTDDTDGLHTMVPSDNACITCHQNGIPSMDFMQSDMATLATLLDGIGIVHDDHPVPGVYSILAAEAAWNYLTVLEDASGGVHNPAYARALIRNSIDALQTN